MTIWPDLFLNNWTTPTPIIQDFQAEPDQLVVFYTNSKRIFCIIFNQHWCLKVKTYHFTDHPL